MNNKPIFLLLLVILVLASCDKNKSVKIKGTIENGYGMVLYLNDPFKGVDGTIDSVIINSKDAFSFKYKTENISFLELKLENKGIMLIANPGEKISIHASEDFTEKYTVSGSVYSEEVNMLKDRLDQTNHSLDSLLTLYKSKKTDEGKDSIEQEMNDRFDAHKSFLISYILKDLKSPANMVALYQKLEDNSYFLEGIKSIQFFKIVNDSLQKYYSGLPFVNALQDNTNALLKEYYTARLLSQAKEIKTSVPNIRLPNENGDTLSLSSYKGKMVLLCFWSPNIEANISFNQSLNSIYKKYKRSDFEIYQVAFEMNTEKWKRLVKFEEYPWKSVNDSKASQSKYLLVYNISNFPTTYLLNDTQEKILGKNLNIRQLDLKINYELNNKK